MARLASSSASISTNQRVIPSTSNKHKTVRCEALKASGSISRSHFLRKGVVLLSSAFTFIDHAQADEEKELFGRYIKKRALEPLSTYVFPLLAAKSELKRAAAIANTDLDAARSLLREGSLSGLRYNVRSVAEYAEILERVSDSKPLVTAVNRSIEAFDSYLLRASRNQEQKRDPTSLVADSLEAIDRLLETVPQDVMDDVTGKTSDAARP